MTGCLCQGRKTAFEFRTHVVTLDTTKHLFIPTDSNIMV